LGLLIIGAGGGFRGLLHCYMDICLFILLNYCIAVSLVSKYDYVNEYKKILDDFRKAAEDIRRKLPVTKQIRIETGYWLNSVVLRMSKNSWSNKPLERPQKEAAIFFSVWVSERSILQNRIYYNIHALRLRELKGFKITSRKFASEFREKFSGIMHHWPNIFYPLGPLTLMEGWVKMEADSFQTEISKIGLRFAKIDGLIDDLLNQYKIPGNE